MIRRATPADPLRVAVLVSGSGTNLQALLVRFAAPGSCARIVAVGSSNGEAGGLERARRAAVPAAVFPSASDRDARVAAWLRSVDAELVVLAGFMVILGPEALGVAPVLNLHPSLLPAFPGADAIGQALAHGARVTGVTVHLVDAGIDTGPIVLQEAARVGYHDDAPTVAARLRLIEHRLLPDAVELVAQDRLRVHGRITELERGPEG